MPGPITSLSITDSGFGYTLAPAVTISAPDLDSARATATATLNGSGGISSISVVDSGAYYVDIPNVTISAPPGGVVTSASVSNTGLAHINGTIYNTTGGTGTGFRIRATSSGGLTSFNIIDGGKNYVAGDQVTTVNSYPATIDIDSVGANTLATARAVLDSDAGGRVSSISIVVVGTGYDSAPTVTIDSADGTAENYRAQGSTSIDSDGKIVSLTIVNGGGGYVTAPTLTIADPPETLVEHNDSATQTLSTGVKVTGEIVKYSDSDHKLYLARVGADDGKYHTFVSGRDITFGNRANIYTRSVLSVTELNNVSQNEQNDDFSTQSDDFLDFTEDNPFGDPENQ